MRVTRNEVAARYAGSLLGAAWSVLAPLLLIAVYAAVYLFVFQVRVPTLSRAGYVLYVFAGLVPFLATSEALSLGVASVIANKAVLNNTVFPIDLAPAKAVLMSQPTMLVGMSVVVAGGLLAHTLSWTALLLPAVWALQVLALFGLNWILSLLNVVFRDLQNIVGLALMVLLVASPIAYTPDMVPAQLRALLVLNPLAYFVTAYQSILVLGTVPAPREWAALCAMAFGLFALGSWLFSRGKRVVTDHV